MSKDTKDLILEDVEKLEQKINSLQEALAVQKEKNVTLHSQVKSRCWWDEKECVRYTELTGLQEAGKRCLNCQRVNWETLEGILEEIGAFASWKESENGAYREKQKEAEKFQDALDEIHERVLNILHEV